MSLERKDIKFRTDAVTLRRMKWAMYWEEIDSQQEAMERAVDYWLTACETKHGPPAEKPPKVSTKRAG